MTRNRNDFLALTEYYFQEGRAHNGVLIVPRSYPGNEAQRIAKASQALIKDQPYVTQPYGFMFL